MTDAGRLATVLQAIEPCGRLIDIGCDHGKLCLAAIKKGLCKQVTACDISLPSLNKAKLLLADCPNVRFVCADGLQALCADCYDTVVISGMGGHEMMRILQEPKGAALVLQPQNAADPLRRFLCANGYRIVMDTVCIDGGKFYDVLRAQPGQQTLNDLEFEWGAFALTRKSGPLTEKLTFYKTLLGTFAATEENRRKLERITEVLKWQTSR